MDAVQITMEEGGIAVVTLDCPGKRVNTLSPGLLQEFDATAARLLDDDDVRAVVLVSAKPDTFIAGADLDVLTEMTDPEQPARLSREGNAMLRRLAEASKPVVAAVHGAALGGGLEVAMACHFILASDDPATVLGQPEVQLGLIPAGGGTQRLPRRVGLTQALDLMLTGRRVRARKALRMGLVDAVTTPGGIAESGVRAARRLLDGTLKPRRAKRSIVDRLAGVGPVRRMVLRKAREQVSRRTRGLYPAPPAILDCVEAGLARGLDRGLECEARHFGELVTSPESRSLVWLFHIMNELKKAPDGGRPVRRLGVLGAGFMGAGIASVSLGRCPVVVRDVDERSLGSAVRTVEQGLAKQVRSGAIYAADRDVRRSRLHPTLGVDDLAGCDLVVEAVFEDLELKRKVLAETEEVITAEAVFASNTSALPIHEIAASARHPERVLGMHYFSPVPKMPLLELVVAETTADWAVATAQAFGAAQGKAVIVVKDGPGFYTTRILAPALNEAMLLLEEGARIEAVDRVLRDFGYPVGPVALVDEVGIDVGAHVARDLGRAFAARGLGASEALPRLAEAGYAGRKNRRGFYRYPKKGRKQPNPDVYELLGGAERRDVDAVEVRDRVALLQVNEAAHCLGEGVIRSPRDGDAGAVLGLGFPPFRGGPFHWVDAVGPAAVVARLEELAGRFGERFRPAPMLAEMARRGGRFYK